MARVRKRESGEILENPYKECEDDCGHELRRAVSARDLIGDEWGPYSTTREEALEDIPEGAVHVLR